MERPRRHSKTETESSMGLGRIRLVQQAWYEPIDICGTSNHHHLELTLMPISRNAKARFIDHWGPHRFEPLGRMFFFPAQQAINARSDCLQQRSIVCDLDPTAVAAWFDQEELTWTDDRLRGALDIGNNRLRTLLQAIGDEIQTPGFAGDTLIELLTAQVAIELSRHLLGIDARLVNGGLTQVRLRRIEQRLIEDARPPSLAELAELCGISVRQLTRTFRNSCGRSIGSYIAEQRLNHAKRMLTQGMSVKAVAFNTGFSAPSNFSAAFTRATGETPRQYRQRHHH